MNQISDAAVWEICAYLSCGVCAKCPASQATDYGPGSAMCRSIAEETIEKCAAAVEAHPAVQDSVRWPECIAYRFAVSYNDRVLFTEHKPSRNADGLWAWIGAYMVEEGKITYPDTVLERPVNL